MHKGKWITTPSESPIFVKGFKLNDIKKATLEICGLGFFEAYLNGKRISDDYFVPAWSDYEPRQHRFMKYPVNDTFSHRTYFLRYDVSEHLHAGKNSLEVWVGNGWYNQNFRFTEGDFRYGMPKLWFELTVTDTEGRESLIVSDETLRWKQSIIVSSNIYAGEQQDFRLEGHRLVTSNDPLALEELARRRDNTPRLDLGGNHIGEEMELMPVSLAEAPKGEFCLQECPPDRIVRTIVPERISVRKYPAAGEQASVTDQCPPARTLSIYDAGENTTGFAVFTIKEKCGNIVNVTYAEDLASDGSIDTTSTGDRPIQIDSFVSDGTNRVCHPIFTYHGFRFFEIEGEVEDVQVYVIHTDIDARVSFTSSSEELNLLFEAYKRSQLSNMHSGVVSDCPHRERLGYTGDGQLTADTAMLIFDGEKFYHKWILDVLDCQDPYSGHVQHTAPFYGGGGGPGGWGGAIVIVPYYHYLHYRDKELLALCYPRMKKWLSYMKNHSEKDLVTSEEAGGWCLGDWCTLTPVELPEPFVNTYFLIRTLVMMQEIARILEIGEDSYLEDIGRISQAWKSAFYDPDKNTYCGGVQGADAFAIELDDSIKTLFRVCYGDDPDHKLSFTDPQLANAELLAGLVRRYTELGSYDTGIFGTDVLTTVLCRHGYVDLAYDLLTGTKPGGFGYLYTGIRNIAEADRWSFVTDPLRSLSLPATTLWEYWDGKQSHNHHMFGAPVKHLFYSFLGINIKDGPTIRPNIPTKLTSASARVNTKQGCVDIAFRKTDDGIEFRISSTADCMFIYGGEQQTLKAGEEYTLRY